MTALSIVIPVFNERGNIGPLVNEVVQHLRGRIPFDIVCVDDQSQDDTRDVLTALKAEVPELRVLVHQRRSGQSTAIRTGVKHALSPWIATLDGDGQNDPADIPKLLAAREQADAQTKLFAGWRVDRKDTASAGPRAGPTGSASACCATTRRTRVAASSCSSAPPSSTCPTSTTCTATCRH